jgi:hypothetical protein
MSGSCGGSYEAVGAAIRDIGAQRPSYRWGCGGGGEDYSKKQAGRSRKGCPWEIFKIELIRYGLCLIDYRPEDRLRQRANFVDGV